LVSTRATPRPADTLGKILIGFILAVVGLPFLGASVAALLMLEGLGRGLAACAAIAAGLLFLAGPQAAAMAALGSCSLYLAVARGRSLVESCGIAAAAMMIGSLVFYASPGSVFMLPYGEQGQVWRQMLLTMGLTSSEASTVIEATFRILPAMAAVWVLTGAALATVFLARLADSRGLALPGTGRLRLGLPAAWLVIAALAARLMPGASQPVVAGADNVLIFMALPYLLVGAAVARRALLGWGISPLPFVLALVLLPHVGMALLAVGGLMDTWFDFRKMLNDRIARKRDEGSAD
jgi:hypothetical protein